MKKNYVKVLLGLSGICALLVAPLSSTAQQSYTFTNAGATGSLGPLAANIATAYAATNLAGSVAISPTPGIQTFTVPQTMGYRITCYGAQGYGTNGGRGASIAGDFTLTAGTVLKILVGQMGVLSQNASANFQYGGGGGSYVTSLANVPYVVAGGGGGSWATTYTGVSDGTTTTNGNAGQTGTSAGAGGTAGGGGGQGNYGDGGGGLTGDGSVGNASASPARSFVNGGTGGTYSFYGIGGFGGGGGTSSYNNTRCGGGGGYSGGGGVDGGANGNPQGGGGGSWNSGVNPTNIAGANIGQGRVVITELCNVRITSSGSNSVSPSICAGQSLTLTTNAVSGYSWSTGNTTNSVIVVAPTANTVITVSGTSSLACQAVGAITIIVNSAAPVLTVTTGQNPICVGATTSLNAIGAVTYTWSGGITNGQTIAPTITTNYTVTGQNGCGITTAVRTITVAPLAVAAAASPTLVCEGYTTALTATSAVTGFTWTPAAGVLTGTNVIVAPLANTIYTVTASDGTCTGTQTVLVTTKTTPTIVPSTTFVTVCLGDAITLSATGAGVNGTYSWSPGGLTTQTITVTPATSTLYVVVGTNSLNCAASNNVPIQVATGPSLTVSTNKALICVGGSATLSAIGASSYSWTGGPTTAGYTVSPTSGTTYTCLAAGATNSCITTKTVQVNVFAPTVVISPSTQICTGASAVISASNANTYTWTGIGPGASYTLSPTTTTNYTLIATSVSLAVSCQNTLTTLVKVNANPTISIAATKTITICKGVSNVLTASGAQNYTWSTSDNTASISVTPSVTTTYSVIGIDVNGCSGTQQFIVNVSKCQGIAESSLDQVISVFPNPNAGTFTIRSSSELHLVLYNAIGQSIRNIDFEGGSTSEISIGNLSAGVYFVKNANDAQDKGIKIVVTN